ncbi:hypothetical protein ABIA33_006384 [Streptacidiphilus sp. MAP12-16]
MASPLMGGRVLAVLAASTTSSAHAWLLLAPWTRFCRIGNGSGVTGTRWATVGP